MGLLDLTRLLRRRDAAAQPQPGGQTDAEAAGPQTRPHGDPVPEPPGLAGPCRFFAYATGRRCLDQQAITPPEREVLRNLDRVLEAPSAVASWIPRPPAVLPRLLACLRDDDVSLREACTLIQADPYLAAEILRLANSARHQHGAPVTELERAATRLGVDGLRRAVSASLLRPLFDALRDPLLGQALPRLWTHAQSKSGWCHAIAPVRGVDAFDAYLAGLTHNIGWIGALKAVGRASIGSTPEYSGEFVLALTRRSERMFACSAEQWAVNDALSRLGATLRACSLEDAGDALAQVLYQADARATAELAAA